MFCFVFKHEYKEALIVLEAFNLLQSQATNRQEVGMVNRTPPNSTTWGPNKSLELPTKDLGWDPRSKIVAVVIFTWENFLFAQ